jgi:transcriptional regulator with XRE-family HTH domain
VYFTRKGVIFTDKKLCIFEPMETSTKPSNTHIGRKISRIRELRGIKQEHLASELGVSQQSISRMEQSEVLEDDILEKIAKILGVTSEGIKNFSEEAVINYFNTFNDNSANNGAFYAQNFHFNPIEKIVELYNEKVELLERLLQAEKEKNDLLKGNK